MRATVSKFDVTEYCNMQSLWLFYVMQSLSVTVLECCVWVYKYRHFLLYGGNHMIKLWCVVRACALGISATNNTLA